MSTQVESPARASSVEGSTLLERTARQVRQLICGMSGHETLFHFDDHRVALKCVSCGYESPGWQMPGGTARSSGSARETHLPKRAA